MLIPSTITARRTCRYTSTLYIPGTIQRVGYYPMDDGGRYSIQPVQVSAISPPTRPNISPPLTAANIGALVDRLRESGSDELVKMRRAEKMNDVWQLRSGAHRIFYFWHAAAQRYVILNGFRKKTRKTPQQELERAENLRLEHLEGRERQ